ncbi:hypothetical protein [Paraburkholderia sp. SIMBA_030]|uniref:hypothetical protein n=1 Tax=Paraburkholderia sp. SIMBA_030 TaxID=3085773 RepID=UPI00397DD177
MILWTISKELQLRHFNVVTKMPSQQLRLDSQPILRDRQSHRSGTPTGQLSIHTIKAATVAMNAIKNRLSVQQVLQTSFEFWCRDCPLN